MHNLDEKQLKTEIDEIMKKVDHILEKIDALDPGKEKPAGQQEE